MDFAPNGDLYVAESGRGGAGPACPPAVLASSASARRARSPVSTSVVRGPDGAYYVGQLTGFPFPEGLANVYRIVPGQEPEVYASGFTHITDLGFGPDGSLYVLQLSKRSLLLTPPGEQAQGALIRVRPNGKRRELAPGALETPTALLVAEDGTSYVSNRGASAGNGQVLEIPAKR